MMLVDRDYKIMQELSRWRFALGRHIKALADFPSIRTTDRRLSILTKAGYIERKKIMYGVPYMYTLTAKGASLIGKPEVSGKIRIEQIQHDIAVLDSVIYFIRTQNISLAEIITEREMHGLDGFGVRKHHPDYIFKNVQVCVEIELTLKAKARLLKNVENNFREYEKQIWIVPDTEHGIIEIINKSMSKYTGVELLPLEVVQDFVRKCI